MLKLVQDIKLEPYISFRQLTLNKSWRLRLISTKSVEDLIIQVNVHCAFLTLLAINPALMDTTELVNARVLIKLERDQSADSSSESALNDLLAVVNDGLGCLLDICHLNVELDIGGTEKLVAITDGNVKAYCWLAVR